MEESVNTNPIHSDLIPEDVRSRLASLAGKLEEERRNLDEARLLREAEVKALKTEISQRENVSQSEKKQLEQDLARWKREYLSFQEKEQEWSKKQGFWENERKDWEYKVQQYKKEIERLQEQLKNKEAVWQAERLALEQTVRKLEKESLDLKNEYQRKIQELELQYEQRINKEVDELERLLNEARESWQKKMVKSR